MNVIDKLAVKGVRNGKVGRLTKEGLLGVDKLNRAVGEGLTKKVTFEERPEGGEEGGAMKLSGEERPQQREQPVQSP